MTDHDPDSPGDPMVTKAIGALYRFTDLLSRYVVRPGPWPREETVAAWCDVVDALIQIKWLKIGTPWSGKFGENQKVTPKQLAKIRKLDDFDLIMLISEIHDHGWKVARRTLAMMPPSPDQKIMDQFTEKMNRDHPGMLDWIKTKIVERKNAEECEHTEEPTS